MSGRFIPERVEELTPEWLTDALRERGLLSDARICEVRHELLGAGEGFLGVVARLFLEFEREQTEVPPTLIAKLLSLIHI